MAIITTNNQHYSDIADAIRGKNGTQNTYLPSQMATAITNIPSGGSTITVEQLNVVANDTYTAPSGKAYSPVVVNVPVPSGYVDVSDTTATADDVKKDKYFYTASGTKTAGLMDLKMGVIRPDAELIATLSDDVSWVNDLSLTIPAYTTTSQTLQAAENMTPTVALTDLDNYCYYVLERALTIPTYNVTTKGKGREEYQFCAAAYEIVSFPANTFSTLDGTKTYGTRNTAVYSAGNYVRLVYWSSSSAITVYGSAAYGCTTTITAPTVSSSSSLSPSLTIKFPAIVIRGNTTYFTNTYMNATTDARTQFVAEVYKIPKASGWGVDCWGLKSQAEHVLDCIDTTNHDLT